MIAPVRQPERVESIDALRGFAIFGILLVNFSGTISDHLFWIDRAVIAGLEALVVGAFYPLFALLFGVGFSIQVRRHRARGQRIFGMWFRRMAALLLIGAAHSILIWSGDILVDYALIGLFLLPVGFLSDKQVVIAMLALGTLSFIHPVLPLGPGGADAQFAREERALREGWRQEELRIRADLLMVDGRSVRGDIETRWARHKQKIQLLASGRVLWHQDILLLFIIGVLLGHVKLLERPSRHRHVILGLLSIALLSAAVTRVILPFAPFAPDAFTSPGKAWAGYLLAGAYATTIPLVMAVAPRLRGPLIAFVPVGRTALSNYILQSVVMTCLFLAPWITPRRYPASLLLVLHVGFFFMIQIPISRWWLDRFEYGPLEWLWRCMSYGRVFRIVRSGSGSPRADTLTGDRLPKPL